MEFGILGPFEVRSASAVLSIRRGLPRTVLVALLLRRGHTVSSDFLVDLLWGDALPRNPANALQIQVSYLRKTLGGAGDGESALLQTRPGGYALVTEPEHIDAHRFETAVRAFTPLDRPTAPTELLDALDEVERALGLWRGEALEDVAGMDFVRGEITRLEELRWAATERRVELQLRLGRHSDAIGELAELVERMPLRERFHAHLVLALYRAGRQADALRAFGDARRTLIDELGIEPGAELRDLERSVLQQDPSLDWVPAVESRSEMAASTVQASTSRRRRSGRLPVPVTPLIGRETQLARLEQLLDGHRAVTLTGPAGAGKTRLAIEDAARNARPVCYVDSARSMTRRSSRRPSPRPPV